jgi:muramoyltetrapeptide carboxypeptidase LdcA involved in peptidoglycan recycling
MFPARLNLGDEIRVIAPSTSMALVKGEQVQIAKDRLESLGFQVTFGKHVKEHDEFFSTSIEYRLEDLHEAFQDKHVKAILTAVGGYSSNQLLKEIRYDLIKDHPKILCGCGDITALQLAIYRKTGLITYYGPHFSTLGMKARSDYTIQRFLEALTNDAPFDIEPSGKWSDDKWYVDQEDRIYYPQSEYDIIQEGEGEGTLIGGNISAIHLLQGTEFMPSLKGAVLFLEDDEECHPFAFDRLFQSLLHLPDADGIKAVIIGRFQKHSNMTLEALKKIIRSKKELKGIPVIANVDFGHTEPIATIPIGGQASIHAEKGEVSISVHQNG